MFSSDATDLTLDPSPTYLLGIEELERTSQQVFVRDLHEEVTTLVSRGGPGAGAGNGASGSGAVSADGRLVAFSSQASDLTPDETFGRSQVFVRDLGARTTVLVSRNLEGTAAGNGGAWSPSISEDGRRVAFASDATDLTADPTGGHVQVFVARIAAPP